MKQNKYLDTITAIASGNINQAISIIRICGSNSLEIIKKIFNGKTGNNKTITYGKIVNPKTNETIDEVLVNWFIGTDNFVGEDTIEINAHGGILVTNKILNLILENGARMAENGEFSRRALLNGKISLDKAEAINNLIHAKTNYQTQIAISEFNNNETYKYIEVLEKELLDIISKCEINIDYSEYNDIEVIDRNKIKEFVFDYAQKIKVLMDKSIDINKVYTGINIVIIGRPNVGKSSLFNLLIEEDKAIVTDIEGTTRDAIDGEFVLSGFLFRVIDTAGIRETTDVVESIGIKKSFEKLEKADIVIHLFDDKTAEFIKKDKAKIEKLCKGKQYISVLNKIDKFSKKDLYKDNIWISVKNKNIYELKNALLKNINNINFESNQYFLNSRKLGQLIICYNSLINALEGIKNNLDIDVLILDLREAWYKLREILNKDFSNEALLDNIFKKFCLGK
ncbi:tRNA uridine-5-carboxymethylaminomethyl(34) synthesis GTPase MnmE [Metamycoplasma hyosynoviae]|uniref:tRNA modification GTPase MnmE n=2 Tax=Metamycoplasma hyosynoviae TaxID=29559 RepID=A0A063YGQ6_9BACT|nr:tRNA uridine-5-carboxymethylaminomethyl(34) synthesis GTPase MnmE [Metamycoplasma hyosynoviae]KDE44904.1 tRNA modification GTPase TrmE [Metamycoplasma hyosynoviae]MDC8900992.1 tRNA uridine-5-carboxymethylaminomethyl(34) synthesis GTPase MnmE [Metamycoplasma hyosynoviae]MDC8912160.1 tRNA uridine-5-carboxymethylaminomethyl(34) synthesis GTPase MnmE [Metamycoplasma hyosynoviae]MDC8914982.1 tRNA uridine-5-carboxymethylaminomethyl(34) synthesis GTPase MnmE [Metamycoplasma hyosynoviae]MDC8916762.